MGSTTPKIKVVGHCNVTTVTFGDKNWRLGNQRILSPLGSKGVVVVHKELVHNHKVIMRKED